VWGSLILRTLRLVDVGGTREITIDAMDIEDIYSNGRTTTTEHIEIMVTFVTRPHRIGVLS
jgi:hypothetical protein